MKIKAQAIKAPRIEMLPLIDVVFLLLVFFIYAMLSMAMHRGMQLDLPESTEATDSHESPFSLTIRSDDKDMTLFLNEKPLLLSQLAQHFDSVDTSNGKKTSVLIFADENIRYQQLYQVLDELKKGGVSDISLQANPE